MSRVFEPVTHYTVTYVDVQAGTGETPMRTFPTQREAEAHIEKARAMDQEAGTRWFQYGILRVTTTRIREPEL